MCAHVGGFFAEAVGQASADGGCKLPHTCSTRPRAFAKAPNLASLAHPWARSPIAHHGAGPPRRSGNPIFDCLAAADDAENRVVACLTMTSAGGCCDASDFYQDLEPRPWTACHHVLQQSCRDCRRISVSRLYYMSNMMRRIEIGDIPDVFRKMWNGALLETGSRTEGDLHTHSSSDKIRPEPADKKDQQAPSLA
jgi:hypothetical protein